MLKYIVLVAASPNGDGMTDFQVVVMVAGFIVGTIAFLVNIIAVIVAVYKMGRAVQKFEMIGERQASEISELKTAVANIASLIADNTILTHRMDTIEHRTNMNDKLIDDLRRGEGRILPLDYSPYRVPPNVPREEPR